MIGCKRSEIRWTRRNCVVLNILCMVRTSVSHCLHYTRANVVFKTHLNSLQKRIQERWTVLMQEAYLIRRRRGIPVAGSNPWARSVSKMRGWGPEANNSCLGNGNQSRAQMRRNRLINGWALFRGRECVAREENTAGPAKTSQSEKQQITYQQSTKQLIRDDEDIAKHHSQWNQHQEKPLKSDFPDL